MVSWRYDFEGATNHTLRSAQDFNTEGALLVMNVTGDKHIFHYSRLSITEFRKHGPDSTMSSPTAKRLESMFMVEELV